VRCHAGQQVVHAWASLGFENATPSAGSAGSSSSADSPTSTTSPPNCPHGTQNRISEPHSIYNPDRALCRRTVDAGGPSLPDCQPLACRNVALDRGNIAALTRHRTHLERALKAGGTIAPYVRHRLEEQLSEMTAFLARHGQPQQEEA
jgi:hypothetical protein